MTTSVPDSHSKAMDGENKKLHIILTSSPQIKVDLFDCKKVKKTKTNIAPLCFPTLITWKTIGKTRVFLIYGGQKTKRKE